ncbi:hypothetical protein HN385_00890 [archaeon]|jgi:hypothetical protein|nr:hypothetical protein [archaeon]MBT3451227.1 hypothetical protein [archaeon]MBT6868678.1 hypothetical protein [archaeon]MBT7193466.1 hypothetical protein [archaeon]MBT7381057.1 hypothetical protein [archaeon]
MTYYCFDKCPEERIDSIEKIALDLGLKKVSSHEHGTSWFGEAINLEPEQRIFINYNKQCETPLIVQTPSYIDHKYESVRKIISDIQELCQANHIYDVTMNDYGIGTFKIDGIIAECK